MAARRCRGVDASDKTLLTTWNDATVIHIHAVRLTWP
jgi:hypothetical protein